jgi:hypothetical protein
VCKRRAETEQTVSMIPDLSIEDAGFLREVVQIGRRGPSMTDIEELDVLAGASRLGPLETEYPTTARRFRRILGLKRGSPGESPVLKAVKTSSAQVCSAITSLT